MIHYKKALLKLKKNKIKIKSKLISVESALNRISALDINSPNNYPAANNTAFDGFAINSKETNKLSKKNIKKFKIIKVLAAGERIELPVRFIIDPALPEEIGSLSLGYTLFDITDRVQPEKEIAKL